MYLISMATCSCGPPRRSPPTSAAAATWRWPDDPAGTYPSLRLLHLGAAPGSPRLVVPPPRLHRRGDRRPHPRRAEEGRMMAPPPPPAPPNTEIVDGNRWYLIGDERFLSVTTALKAVAK